MIHTGSDKSLKGSSPLQRAGYSVISSELSISYEKWYISCINIPIEANTGDTEMVVLKQMRVALKILICH
jgi:hypothetical protein